MSDTRRFVASPAAMLPARTRRPGPGTVRRTPVNQTRYPALAAAAAQLEQTGQSPNDATAGATALAAADASAEAPRVGEPAPVSRQPAGCRVVLVSADAALIDAVALIGAAAGVELQVSGDPPGEREDPAAVLLVGADRAAALALPGLLPGSGHGPGTVVLVGHGAESDVLWRAAAARPGVRVAVLPAAGPWLGEYLGELGVRTGTARVVVFAGTGGGVGTTTAAVLAAAARTLAGERVLLVDGDARGTGLWPRLKGPVPEGIGWDEVRGSSGRLAPAQLAQILPLAAGTAVLTHGPPGSGRTELTLLPEVLAAGRRIFDVVVLDAGRTADLEPGVLALCDAGVAVIGAVTGPVPVNLPGNGTPPFTALVQGRLRPGTDPRALAGACGLDLLAYLPRRRVIERAAAEGRLMSVLAHRRLAAAMLGLTGPVLP